MKIFDQNVLSLTGNGKIIYECYEIETNFKIEYSPFDIKIFIPRIEMEYFSEAKFVGENHNDKLRIACSKICFRDYSINGNEMIFSLLDDLIIGEDSHFNLFKANLFGLNIKFSELKIGNFIVSANIIDNFDEINSFNNKFGCLLESGSLIIKDINSENLNKLKTIEFFNDICLLLSFLLAKKIASNRYEFSNEDKKQNIIRIKTSNNGKGRIFIDNESIINSLPTLYDNYSKLKANEKKCFFTSIDYLNSIFNNYLEDSILKVAQVWEILSDTFLVQKVNNTQSISDLRNEIKSTINLWHKNDKSKDYDIAHIRQRIFEALDWEKAKIKLSNLVEEEKINIEKIGLNISDLIDLRNDIAHEGRFKELGKENEYLKIQYAAILGINILMLNKLGYICNLKCLIDDCITIKNIDWFLIK